MTPTIVKAESGYIKDPLALFYELTQGTKNNILLESQEIHTKAGTQSLLGVSSALRTLMVTSCPMQLILNAELTPKRD